MEQTPNPLVLVVDDEPLVRLLAAEALGDAGFPVVEAINADHALELLDHYDEVGVLFTDVNMPGSLDGLALARLVHARRPDIQIVVTSGRLLPEDMPDDGRFLPKPYNIDEMTRLIGQALRTLPERATFPSFAR